MRVLPTGWRAGLPLLAQHVDPIDAGTLVDIFRDDPRASLLGTDALRDGVDVPGKSLRLVIMERVPWPRPTVLHGARRLAGGGSPYDDRVVRARLAQAFGRLIRRQRDRGVFVILSAAMPSRLLSAFPSGVPIRRVPLEAAIARVADRLVRTGWKRGSGTRQMKRLTILRHAKSSWDDASRDDFDRPLNPRGWKDARRVGRELNRRSVHFDFGLASPAARVRETLDGVAEGFGEFTFEIRFEPRVYEASAATLLDLVRGLPETRKRRIACGA